MLNNQRTLSNSIRSHFSKRQSYAAQLIDEDRPDFEMKIECHHKTRPAVRPLQVYLDSADYSVLSTAMTDANHPDAGTFSYLCQMVDQGKIEVRFAAIHLVEMAHLDAESKQFALSRVKCLQRLCGGKCFRYWLEMRNLEVVNILSNQPVWNSITNNESRWHPDLSKTAISLRQELFDGFRKIAVEKTLNRKQRRALERRFFPNGRLSKEGVRALQANRDVLLTELSKQFPFSDRFYDEDLVLQFATGKVSAAEFVEEMGVVFRDVEKFIGWTYDTRDNERKLVSWLRDYGRDLALKIETLRRDFDGSIRPFLDPSEIKKKMSEVLERTVDRLRQSELAKIRSEIMESDPSIVDSDNSWTVIMDSSLGSIPSLDVFVTSFAEYFRRNIQMNRRVKPSDAADLFHMVHLPYCDLFRADADAAEIARLCAPLYNSIIVSKLRDLPEQINVALTKGFASTQDEGNFM